MQADSFTPAHSAFGLPIYVAPRPAGSIQCVCHRTLLWLVSLLLGLTWNSEQVRRQMQKQLRP